MQAIPTMDSISRVEYNIRDLGTRAVTLFPTKAQVSRDIKDVPLRPGTNEITILGLAPTVDEHSIKVEGSGAATIVDMTVEPVPNRELFEDVYPDSDDDSDAGSDDGEPDVEDIVVDESPELTAAKERLRELSAEMEMAAETVQAGESSKRYLDLYFNSLHPKHETNLEQAMASFKAERLRAHQACMDARELCARLGPERELAWARHNQLLERHQRDTAKANREMSKIRKRRAAERRIRESRRAERLKEKARVRAERESFWPKYCYAVHIKLEAAALTPAPSSVDTVMDDDKGACDVDGDDDNVRHCNLVVSYMTGAACWQPSYDLQLDTTGCTGVLSFDAHISNTTSETWERCKVTLSTSQAAFSGLVDAPPQLEPWNIVLKPKGDGYGPDPLLRSREEVQLRSKFWEQQQLRSDAKPRGVMFGVDKPQAVQQQQQSAATQPGPAPQGKMTVLQTQDYQMQLMLLEQQNKKRLMMARQEKGGPSGQLAGAQFAQTQAQAQAPRPGEGAFPVNFGSDQISTGDVLNDFDFDAFLADGQPAQSRDGDGDRERQLSVQESLIDHTGFTTTYDLPGLKTLVPRTTPTSQRVARVRFPDVSFRHTVVAKYRPAAHLSAKLQNDSAITLVRGPAGVSLDGSFLGRVELGRCGVGEHLVLQLGVDPAISVAYPPPQAHRAARGFFAKDGVRVYERCVRLENRRPRPAASTSTSASAATGAAAAAGSGAGGSGRPAKLFVLDQIPVAEDERLRVDLLQPDGLVCDGDSRPAGQPDRSLDGGGSSNKAKGKDGEGAWGRASAHLRKGGQVQWLVYLEPGSAVKLPLVYQVAVPNNEEAVQAPKA